MNVKSKILEDVVNELMTKKAFQEEIKKAPKKTITEKFFEGKADMEKAKEEFLKLSEKEFEKYKEPDVTRTETYRTVSRILSIYEDELKGKVCFMFYDLQKTETEDRIKLMIFHLKKLPTEFARVVVRAILKDQNNFFGYFVESKKNPDKTQDYSQWEAIKSRLDMKLEGYLQKTKSTKKKAPEFKDFFNADVYQHSRSQFQKELTKLIENDNRLEIAQFVIKLEEDHIITLTKGGRLSFANLLKSIDPEIEKVKIDNIGRYYTGAKTR